MTIDNNTPPRKTLSLNSDKIDKNKLQEKLQTSNKPSLLIQSLKPSAFKNSLSQRNIPRKTFNSPPQLTKAEQKRIKKEEARLAKEAAKKAKAIKHQKETKRSIQEGKAIRFDNTQKVLQWLQLKYPECFNLENPKPLKLHITNDILNTFSEDQGVSKTNIRQAIKYYTHNPKYLHTLINSQHRVNLNGEHEGIVTTLQQEKALEQIKEFQEYIEKIGLEKQQKHEEWKKQQKPKERFQGSYEQLQRNVRAAIKVYCEDIVKRHMLASGYKNKTIEEMLFNQSRYEFNIPSLLQNECKGLIFFIDNLPDKGNLESVDYRILEANKSFWMVKTKTCLYRVWIRTGYAGVCGPLSHQIEGFFNQNRDLFRREGIQEIYPFFNPASYIRMVKGYNPKLLTSLLFIAYLNYFMEGKSEQITSNIQRKISYLMSKLITNNKKDLPESILNNQILMDFCIEIYKKNQQAW